MCHLSESFHQATGGLRVRQNGVLCWAGVRFGLQTTEGGQGLSLNVAVDPGGAAAGSRQPSTHVQTCHNLD